MSLAKELAEKYGFTNQGYERSDFVAALKELQERCAKEAEAWPEEGERSIEKLPDGSFETHPGYVIAARIRSL